ncbi:MAG TPA: lysylphosphatidylglycerol synthase transmembrane domain-containing protein [Candidatus Cybelea sp.]|nr:lysylphosphatidylglycerol synthase transmembrane domain-containing protein [Candidatus Cybelea sp.]
MTGSIGKSEAADDGEAVTAPAGSAGGSWKSALSWLSGLLILAGVVLVALHFTELTKFVELARRAQPLWLLAAAALQAGTYFASAGVWWVALKRAHQPRPFLALVPMGLAKLFTDQALPTGGIGGTLLIVAGLNRRGVPKGIAMAILLVGMISFYAAYLLAVVIAIGILYVENALDRWMVIGAGAFLVIAFGVPLFVLMVRRWVRVWPFTLVPKVVPALNILVEAMEQAPPRVYKDPVSLILTGLLELVVFALDAATLWTMLHAVGSDGDLLQAYAGFMMASVAATVGPMPLGLGTFEAVSTAGLHIQGQSVEAALTATLLLRGFTFWLPMIPGLVLARRELQRHVRHHRRQSPKRR